MSMDTQALQGGFGNPVLDAQATFRALMDAMAHPGTVRTCTAEAEPPYPLNLAQGAVALTLADHDTPVWLSTALAKPVIKDWIAFHTGADIAAAPAHGRFAFIGLGDPIPDFLGFAAGSQDYPDRSATLAIEVPSLAEGPALTARGPGIQGEIAIAPQGLPADFVRRWSANRSLFPRGIDLVLTSGTQLMALPRSIELQTTGG